MIRVVARLIASAALSLCAYWQPAGLPVAAARPAAQPAAPAKRALLIGINKYKHAATSGFGNLSGCVNDAENMRALLVGKFEFPNDADHLRLLSDEQATHAGIRAAIEQQLIAKAQ